MIFWNWVRWMSQANPFSTTDRLLLNLLLIHADLNWCEIGWLIGTWIKSSCLSKYKWQQIETLRLSYFLILPIPPKLKKWRNSKSVCWMCPNLTMNTLEYQKQFLGVHFCKKWGFTKFKGKQIRWSPPAFNEVANCRPAVICNNSDRITKLICFIVISCFLYYYFLSIVIDWCVYWLLIMFHN